MIDESDAVHFGGAEIGSSRVGIAVALQCLSAELVAEDPEDIRARIAFRLGDIVPGRFPVILLNQGWNGARGCQ